MTRTATRTEPESPGPRTGITIRAQYPNTMGMLGKIASAIGGAGGDIGAVDIVRVVKNEIVRDISVATRDDLHAREVVKAVRDLPQVTVREVSDPLFLMHLGGKIEIHSKVPLHTRRDLSMAYTPGVARISMAVAGDPPSVWALTIKRNTVAVVSDGTAVLGLGDTGPEAAPPRLA